MATLAAMNEERHVVQPSMPTKTWAWHPEKRCIGDAPYQNPFKMVRGADPTMLLPE